MIPRRGRPVAQGSNQSAVGHFQEPSHALITTAPR